MDKIDNQRYEDEYKGMLFMKTKVRRLVLR